jgi:hypothetical protein
MAAAARAREIAKGLARVRGGRSHWTVSIAGVDEDLRALPRRRVLTSRRALDVPELGARVSTYGILHARYRLHAVENRRVVCEDAALVPAFERCGHGGRPVATLLVDGAARVRAHDKAEDLAPGDVLAMDAKDAIVMRQEGARYAALAFEWDPDWLGARPAAFTRARVDHATLAELDAIALRMAAGASTAAMVVRVVEVLRAGGVDVRIPSEDECVEEVSDKTAALAAALDDMLSNLDEQPMITDLERRLGVTSRQVNRIVASYNKRYGFNAVGWSDARSRRRLFVGFALMTVPGATAELVAHAVGYRAPSAFSNALKEAGLTAPSAVAKAVAALAAR